MTSDSGLAVIRSALLARAKKGHFTPLARDHGLGTATLEEFAHGRAALAPDILSALAHELFGHNVTYDPTIDPLRRAALEPIPMGSPPPPLPSTLPTFKGGPPPPQPGYASKPMPKATPRQPITKC